MFRKTPPIQSTHVCRSINPLAELRSEHLLVTAGRLFTRERWHMWFRDFLRPRLKEPAHVDWGSAIGVLFNIDDLGGGSYGTRAFRILMRQLDPRRIGPAIIFHGDTNATLLGLTREYVIAITMPRDPAYVKCSLASLSVKGLVDLPRRLLDGQELEGEPLVWYGNIDAMGRLVTETWNRGDHDLCKEAGWPYDPRRITVDLDDRLRSELRELRRTKTHVE